MSPKGFVSRSLAAAGLLLFSSATVFAATPIGSTNVTNADPSVPRPLGKPCVVQLFSNDTFVDFSDHPYSYAPPTGCNGKWAKVVLEADFSVTAGRQFDRTASLWLGGVNLYFGTTEEPSATVAPSWHVERDLTDYGALLRQAGNGRAVLGNVVDGTYTGVISGSAKLLFYPASILAPAARVPDAVYPLGSDPIGSTATLNTSSDTLSKALSLPRNVERAYLDVFTQSQNNDEFWYTCVPNQYTQQTGECGGGNFREAEISIDGQPAGVAPVYPWIYTGGLSDPSLWRPTTGLQALNFMPYRVDLTPFAGVLSNGAQHTVAVSVAGANTYFSATASLLVYLDARAHQVNGAITRNTLVGQPPNPTIGDTLVTDGSGNITGNVSTKLSRHFVIEGYADTSHGRVTSTVDQTVAFANTEGFNLTATGYDQTTDQLTTVTGVSRSRLGLLLTGEYRQNLSYPLHIDSNQQGQPDGGYTLATVSHQGYQQHRDHQLLGLSLYTSDVGNAVDSTDAYTVSGNVVTGHTGRQSGQTFTFKDSLGSCYRTDVATQNGAVSGYGTGQGCLGHANRVQWFAHPDGSPDNGSTILGW